MKKQTIATIMATADTPIAVGQLGLLATAPIAKNADKPAVQPATVTCFVRSLSLLVFGSLVEFGGVVSFMF